MDDMGIMKFYAGKRVLVTGHTGFKGSWLCFILLKLGAEVSGYALVPEGENLFDICGVKHEIRSIIGDIRDENTLTAAFREARPDVVLHLAAQPLVQEGYHNPALTYETNVMGTVRVLDCARRSESVGSVINVTTDKVYRNEEWVWGYRETDILAGHDPYSNSKSCSELVTQCYNDSFFAGKPIGVSTLRAGNVIGGGDFAKDRIIPDCIRAALAGRPVLLRNPGAVRPYQHVLEPLFAYLLVAEQQYRNPQKAGSYNTGPEQEGCLSNRDLVQLFCEIWGDGMHWESPVQPGYFPEANTLRLDCSKIAAAFGWQPRWGIRTAIQKTVEWTRGYKGGDNVGPIMQRQIDEFIAGGGADD